MEWKKINELYVIKKGKKEEALGQPYEDSCRYIQIEDLRNDDNIKYCVPTSKSVTVNPEDIIIAWDGANAGTIGVGLNGVIGSTLAKLELKCGEVDSYYVATFLKSKFNYLRERCTGATIPHISRKVLEELAVPLPSLETQQKIVQVLDKAQSLIDKRKEQIELMDELVQSTFYEMFGDPVVNSKGWPIKILANLISKLPQNGLYKPQGKYVKNGEGTPILRIDAFYDGKVTNWNLKRLNCNSQEIDKFGLEVGDIVINRVNSIEYLGKCAYIDRIYEDTVYESNMMRFSPDPQIINPQYLTKLLCHRYVYNQILIRAKKAVNQASINQKDVLSLDIIVPDLPLQNQFAEIVQKIEAQKQLMEQSLTEMENNYNSLMQRAFKGELM